MGKKTLGDPTPFWLLQQLLSPGTALRSVCVVSCLWGQEGGLGRGRIGRWEEEASGMRFLGLSPAWLGPYLPPGKEELLPGGPCERRK